jgi:putative membrane protein
MEAMVGTLLGRWYVTLFGITFAVAAVRHLGWRRTVLYGFSATLVGIVAENGAVRWGVPYTRYAFEDSLRGEELFAGDVPLMVSLSYTFMGYFAFAAARLVASGPWRTRGRGPWLEYATAVVLSTWALWVVDPVSRLGEHFFLGRLFTYDGPGFWFGLPLGSQIGFAATSMALVGILTWLARDEPPDPAVVATADALAGAALIVYLPLVLVVALQWRQMAPSPVAAKAVEDGQERIEGPLRTAEPAS